MIPRWQPFGDMRSLGDVRAEINRLQNEMNRLFRSFDPGDVAAAATGTTYPLLNLWEDDDVLYAEAELPGMDLNDLEIYVNGSNQLSIQGERKEPPARGGTWHRQERGYGRFSRLFELPAEVDADKVAATLKNGVLNITMPKREEAKPRRISVQVE